MRNRGRICRCKRCGYEWAKNKRNISKTPVRCAKCGSPYWNKPKKKAADTSINHLREQAIQEIRREEDSFLG